MNSKTKRTMRIKLSSVDILEITKSLKGGWLDMDKVTSFKTLLDGYNPPKQITQRQMHYYCKCLYKGLGYTPTDEATINKIMLSELPANLKEKWERGINDGSVYKTLIRNAFFGMIAIRALGGSYTPKNEDYSFCEEEADFEL